MNFAFSKNTDPETEFLLYIEFIIDESSHQRCSVWKGVFWNFAKFAEKHLRQSLLFNKVAVVRLVTLLKKRLWHRSFSREFY